MILCSVLFCHIALGANQDIMVEKGLIVSCAHNICLLCSMELFYYSAIGNSWFVPRFKRQLLKDSLNQNTFGFNVLTNDLSASFMTSKFCPILISMSVGVYVVECHKMDTDYCFALVNAALA